MNKPADIAIEKLPIRIIDNNTVIWDTTIGSIPEWVELTKRPINIIIGDRVLTVGPRHYLQSTSLVGPALKFRDYEFETRIYHGDCDSCYSKVDPIRQYYYEGNIWNVCEKCEKEFKSVKFSRSGEYLLAYLDSSDTLCSSIIIINKDGDYYVISKIFHETFWRLFLVEPDYGHAIACESLRDTCHICLYKFNGVSKFCPSCIESNLAIMRLNVKKMILISMILIIDDLLIPIDIINYILQAFYEI